MLKVDWDSCIFNGIKKPMECQEFDATAILSSAPDFSLWSLLFRFDTPYDQNPEDPNNLRIRGRGIFNRWSFAHIYRNTFSCFQMDLGLRTQMQNLALSMAGSEEPRVSPKAIWLNKMTLRCTICFVTSCQIESQMLIANDSG